MNKRKIKKVDFSVKLNYKMCNKTVFVACWTACQTKSLQEAERSLEKIGKLQCLL